VHNSFSMLYNNNKNTISHLTTLYARNPFFFVEASMDASSQLQRTKSKKEMTKSQKKMREISSLNQFHYNHLKLAKEEIEEENEKIANKNERNFPLKKEEEKFHHKRILLYSSYTCKGRN
jgi:hypothetical protein